MFIKQSAFEKILNKSFKGAGFTIARLDEVDSEGEIREKYVIQSSIGTWRIMTDVQYMPKEAKASIIKLIGEMPGKGECWTANKDSVQVEMIETVMSSSKTHKSRLTKTDIYIQDERVYQDFENKKIYLVRGVFDAAVCTAVIDENYESAPAGPYIDTSDKFICWENETTYLEICKGFIEPDSNMESVIQQMEEISFIQM